MDCSCITPLTPAVIVIRGFVFQPLFCILLISGLYFACFCVRAYSGNLSWQYVNSMNCIVYVCVKVVMGLKCGLGRLVCKGYLVLVWLDIGNLFVGMYILLAIWDCLFLVHVIEVACVC